MKDLEDRHYVGSLPTEELLLLDGKCSREAQVVVDFAKKQIELRVYFESCAKPNWVSRLATEIATNPTWLNYQPLPHPMDYCPVCEKLGERVHPGRYASKTKKIDGIELCNYAFKVTTDRIKWGCCKQCWNKWVREALLDCLLFFLPNASFSGWESK